MLSLMLMTISVEVNTPAKRFTEQLPEHCGRQQKRRCRENTLSTASVSGDETRKDTARLPAGSAMVSGEELLTSSMSLVRENESSVNVTGVGTIDIGSISLKKEKERRLG